MDCNLFFCSDLGRFFYMLYFFKLSVYNIRIVSISEDNSMKINRLLEIVTILLNRESVTARELAGRFGVSTRTIYRDVNALSSAGIPVYTNKGNSGGISLLENFTFNKTLLSS